MKKIPSLFKRDYENTRKVYNEIVPGSEWVTNGEGVATEKYDGTACMVRDGKLYKRYDRKPSKRARRTHIAGTSWLSADFKPEPPSWWRCEDAPNLHTGHWPGWLPVGTEPESKWHLRGWQNMGGALPNGTYELVGPRIGKNPHDLERHEMWPHGNKALPDCPRDYDGLLAFFAANVIEGIVWHHPDGRMVKIKRRDFGLPWPDRR